MLNAIIYDFTQALTNDLLGCIPDPRPTRFEMIP